MRALVQTALGVLTVSCGKSDEPEVRRGATEQRRPREQPDTKLLARLEVPLETGVAAWLRGDDGAKGLAPIVPGAFPDAIKAQAQAIEIASVELGTVEASVYWFSETGATVRTDFRWLVREGDVTTIGFAATTPNAREHHDRRTNDSTDLRDVAEGFQSIPRAIQLAVRDGSNACLTPRFAPDSSAVPEPLRPVLADDLGKPLDDQKLREKRVGGTCQTLRDRQPFRSKHVAPGIVRLVAKNASNVPTAIITGTLVQLRERGMPLQLTLTELKPL